MLFGFPPDASNLPLTREIAPSKIPFKAKIGKIGKIPIINESENILSETASSIAPSLVSSLASVRAVNPSRKSEIARKVTLPKSQGRGTLE